MGAETGIQYVHHTWNMWRGCEKISLARVLAKDVAQPLAWDRAAAKAGVRRRIFMSMNDWLEDHPELEEPRARLLKLINETPNLDWLLLTKRPENFKRLMRRILDAGLLRVSATKRGVAHWNAADWLHGVPPGNVWLGVSVEDQETAEARIPELLDTPAALRWVSYEPALGPVDFRQFRFGERFDCEGAQYYDALRGSSYWVGTGEFGCAGPQLNWIVVGGESGKGARPFDVQWARDTIRQCRAACVPVFVKQLGKRPVIWECADPSTDHWEPEELRLRDPKGGDPLEWPEDLRVREMPERSNA